MTSIGSPRSRRPTPCWSGAAMSLYLCHWMRQSGLADLLPSLRETVYVGVSAGSMVTTPDFGGDLRRQRIRSRGATARWDWLTSRCFRTSITRTSGHFPGQRRKMGRGDTGAGVRDRRSDRHQSGRRRRRGRLRGALEAVHPLEPGAAAEVVDSARDDLHAMRSGEPRGSPVLHGVCGVTCRRA